MAFTGFLRRRIFARDGLALLDTWCYKIRGIDEKDWTIYPKRLGVCISVYNRQLATSNNFEDYNTLSPICEIPEYLQARCVYDSIYSISLSLFSMSINTPFLGID